jgi:DNA (cytosine-5)-methyltransferase 1
VTAVDERPEGNLRVVDLFCGPGGLSEGLRQAGCDTVFALDYDTKAVESFAANHPEATVVRDDIRNLDPSTLPECDIIVGGPPCVEFSTAKGSRGNVLYGLELVQAYLRIVHYVKPRWWIMENVPRVTKFLPETIPLSWIGLDEDGSLSIPVRNTFNAAEYGVPQRRKRFLMGNYPAPSPTHSVGGKHAATLHGGGYELPRTATLGDILTALPNADGSSRKRTCVDPNYGFKLPVKELTDQFHETWIAPQEVERLRAAKLNHPYMGRMSFPDDLSAPARTVVATQLGRETLVIEEGGRFRRPTVREVATLQSFPLTYQFFGSPSARYRLVGDAVPPLLGYAIGKLIREDAGLPQLMKPLGANRATRRAPELPPLPDHTTRKAKNKPDRKFSQMIPGKEVRGCRAEFDNRAAPDTNEAVRWRGVLHVGEGSARLDMEVDTTVALRALRAFADNSDVNERVSNIFGDADEVFSTTQVKSEVLQRAWVDASQIGGPDVVVQQLCDVVDRWLPRAEWGDFRRTTSELPILRTSGIRLRVAIGLALAAGLAEVANSTKTSLKPLHQRWASMGVTDFESDAAKSATDRLSLF